MHENTKKLRDIMQSHRLKASDVAAITNREAITVRIWRCRNTARIIPIELLRLVELSVAADAGVTHE